MPEKEKPPARRVDPYFPEKAFWVRFNLRVSPEKAFWVRFSVPNLGLAINSQH